MDREELITQAKRLIETINDHNEFGKCAEVKEFLRIYGGRKNSFLQTLDNYQPHAMKEQYLKSLLWSFIDFLEAGLHADISPERQAELDVVSDYLEMANLLLENTEIHSASAAMIIGATLEEFLRTWIVFQGLSLGSRKPGIENYSQILREVDLITKQDSKDITAWAGLRNHAAHGEWDEVADKKRISIMLEGVNLFLRKYSIS